MALLLDSVNAAGAWSFFRKVRTAYTGDALLVRRSSDSTTLAIGFDSHGYLDVSALLSFVGAGTGTIVTVYDQSGNARDLSAPSTSEEPRIVNAGALEIMTGTGKPRANFTANTWIERGDSCGFTGHPDLTSCQLVEFDDVTLDTRYWIVGFGALASIASWVVDTTHRFNGAAEFFTEAGTTASDTPMQISNYIPATDEIQDGRFFVDGTELSSASANNPTSTLNLTNNLTRLGAVDDGTGNAVYFETTGVAEWVLFDGLSDANRSTYIAEQIDALWLGVVSGSAAGTSTASANVVNASPANIAGTAAGTSTASATITGLGAVAGSSTGTSTAAAIVSGSGAVSGSAAGTSTAAASLTAVGAVAGSSAGTSSATGTITATGSVAGVTAGTSTASATIAGMGAVAGSSAGTSTATANVTAGGGVSGTAAGTSTASATVTGTGAVAGAAVGTSTATASVRGTGAVAGTAAGTSTATASVSDGSGVRGTAQGTSTATATVTGRGAVAGTASGTSTATVNVVAVAAVQGSAAGTSTASATIAGRGAIAGTAAGSSTATADVFSGTLLLSGSAAGTSTAAAAVTGIGAVSGSAAGTSTATCTLAGSVTIVSNARYVDPRPPTPHVDPRPPTLFVDPRQA